MTLRDALLRGRRRPRIFGSGSPVNDRGDGYEFVELRAYVPGDDVRRIDWAATARAGALQSRVVLEDVALTLAATVDESASMRVGRKRALLDAAYDVLDAWYGCSLGDDRCIRIATGTVAPPRAIRGERSAREARAVRDERFNLRRSLETAMAALPRGTAYLAISDFFDLDAGDEPLLMRLGARYDCTALVARDPWYDGLPVSGFVRFRGAEGGSARVFVGKTQRRRFADAVRSREERIITSFERANWRVGIVTEHDPAGSLAAAFGLHRAQVKHA